MPYEGNYTKEVKISAKSAEEKENLPLHFLKTNLLKKVFWMKVQP